MAWKNWDQHIVNDVIEFAQEYSNNIPNEKGSLPDIVLYVYGALSKKGINKSKQDIKNLLLNPPSFSKRSSKDSPKPTSSDRKSESNCKQTETPPQQPLKSQQNTKTVDGGVSQKEVPNGKSDTKMSLSQRQKQSENQADTIVVLDGNKKNTTSSNSKTEAQATSIGENKIAVMNNTPGVSSSKVCRQDDKALKSKPPHDAQPPVNFKRRSSGAIDDVVAESKCSNIGGKSLQTSALETNIEKVGEEITEKKCEGTAKVDIPVEKTYTNTQNKQNKAEHFNVIKSTERNKRNMRSSSTSDSSKTDSGILDVDKKKTGANYDISKPDFPKTYGQDRKSLKLKRNHDTQQAIKRRKSSAADAACSQGDGVDASNCGNTGETIPQPTEMETHAVKIDGEVTDKKCEEAAREEILVEKTDTDTTIITPKKLKKSEKEVNASTISERNKRNMRSLSSSDSSKTDAGILNIEKNNTGANNDVPKTGSPKTCKQDGKSLKLKQKHDAQPALKSQLFGDTDVACLQVDGADASNCGNIGEKIRQTTALEKHTENVNGEVTEKKCEEAAKNEILVGKTDEDTIIATPKKQNKSEKEVNVSKIPERNKRNMRSSSSSYSSKTDTGILNIEDKKIIAINDLPETSSPKTCKQDGKPLKLKQKHDAQQALKSQRFGDTDVACLQGDGIDESNCSNIGEESLQTSVLEINTENVDGKVTDKKCKEAAREEVLVEKTYTDTIIATPKKLKKSEKEVNVSKIQERSKRNMRSSSSDSSKTNAGVLNIEKNKTGANNDVPKSGSAKTSKQDEKSLKLEQKHDAQPADKKRRSCDTDVACLQENSAIAKDTVAASEKDIGPDIKTEAANKIDKSVPLKKKISDEFNEIKIDKTSKRPKKSDRNKRTRSASNAKNSTTSDETICKNLNKESGINKLLKTDSSKIVVQADVHVPMEINCMETISTPSHDSSHIDSETRKEENIANESVTDSSENHTHCDVQKPLQTAASSSSTQPCEDVSVTKTAKTEHIENKINNKLVETVSSKIHNQSSAQKSMRTRAAKKTSTTPSENITISAGTVTDSKFVNEENDKSVGSSKSSTQSEVERRATSQPSTQSGGGVASVNIIGDSAQAESIFQATTRNVSELDQLKIKPEEMNQEIMVKNEKKFDTANLKPKCPPGPIRKAYLRERQREYQKKKRNELRMKQLVENPTPPGFEPGKRHNQNVHAKEPLREPFHVAASFWQQNPTCHVPIPRYPQTVSERPRQRTNWQRLVGCQYNTHTPLRPYWQHSHTTSVQNQNLIYVKPLRRIATKAEESKITTPVEACPDSCSNEEPPLATTTEESGEWNTTIPSTTEPVPQISTAPSNKGSYSNPYSKVHLHRKHRYMRDYFASERVGEGILDVRDVEPDLPFKKIKLQSPTPQAPPLCSFQDIMPILDADSSSDTKDQTDASPSVPDVQGTTESAPASETETGPSSQGLNGLNFSPPLSPSMVYPDTPRSTKQTLDYPGDKSNNNTQISEQLLNKITQQVCERVAEQVCERVTAQVSESVTEQVSRRVEEQLLRGLDDMKRILLEALKSSAKNDQL